MRRAEIAVRVNLRKIKSYLIQKEKIKCFAIILMVVMSYSVFNLTQMSSTTIGNPKGYARQIIDESVTQQPKVSIKDVNDQHFRSFITSVTDHVLSKFSGTMPCQENLDNESGTSSQPQAMINLVFVRLPLVTSGNEPLAPAPSLDAPQSDLTCQLDSPWVHLMIRRSTSPLVRAVFVWNERQFLVDQVLLSGQDPSLTMPPIPLTSDLFEQYARDYADSEILQLPSPEQSQAKTTIDERIPADVLWLFRHSWQSTRGPFSESAWSAMRDMLERVTENYINLVVALFDQCFASKNSEQRYESILDVQDIIPLEEYQIHRLHNRRI